MGPLASGRLASGRLLLEETFVRKPAFHAVSAGSANTAAGASRSEVVSGCVAAAILAKPAIAERVARAAMEEDLRSGCPI